MSPYFISGQLGGRRLWMRVVPAINHLEYEPGLPRSLLGPGAMAIFFWL